MIGKGGSTPVLGYGKKGHAVVSIKVYTVYNMTRIVYTRRSSYMMYVTSASGDRK